MTLTEHERQRWARHVELWGGNAMPNQQMLLAVAAHLAETEARVVALTEALNTIAQHRECDGPGCPFCEGYGEHPLSSAGRAARAALAGAKEADDAD